MNVYGTFCFVILPELGHSEAQVSPSLNQTIKIIKDQKEVPRTKFPKILPKEPINHTIPLLGTNLTPKQEIEGSLNLSDDVEVKDDLNIGSFTPFADLERRKAVDFRNRVKRYLMIIILVMLGPTVFFSIYSISEILMRDQPV